MLLATAAAALASACSVIWVYAHGFTLYWGDAESHLNIARRVVEARTTGYFELGSPWLPLPHVLMLPLVVNDWLWRSGLAGAIPCALSFTTAAVFLFASARRVLGAASAWCAMALFVLNPNALYVQSIPMTEAVFFAALMGILFFTTRYRESQSMADLLGAAVMCLAASLTRYEGWIIIPFVALYVLVRTPKGRITRTLIFGTVASAGAAWWLFYNWQLCSNALNFYNGPDSAMAIQRGLPYPGHGNWKVAIQYFITAASLVSGWPLVWIGGIGAAVALWRRAVWPVALLALWPFFIVWSMHSASQPIHIPPLPPFSWYNTRYALSMLPLLAFGASALAPGRLAMASGASDVAPGGPAMASGASDVARGGPAISSGASGVAPGGPAMASGASALAPGSPAMASGASDVAPGNPAMASGASGVAPGSPTAASIVSSLAARRPAMAAAAVVLFCAGFWLFHIDHENWITWKESEQNSLARRSWTHAAADYLSAHARPTDTFFTTFGDISAVYREAGIPFTRTLTWDDNEWQAAVNRPDLFLWEDWVVAQCGDVVDETVHRAKALGVHYDLATQISVPGAEAIEIYRRHEYPVR